MATHFITFLAVFTFALKKWITHGLPKYYCQWYGTRWKLRCFCSIIFFTIPPFPFKYLITTCFGTCWGDGAQTLLNPRLTYNKHKDTRDNTFFVKVAQSIKVCICKYSISDFMMGERGYGIFRWFRGLESLTKHSWIG